MIFIHFPRRQFVKTVFFTKDLKWIIEDWNWKLETIVSQEINFIWQNNKTATIPTKKTTTTYLDCIQFSMAFKFECEFFIHWNIRIYIFLILIFKNILKDIDAFVAIYLKVLKNTEFLCDIYIWRHLKNKNTTTITLYWHIDLANEQRELNNIFIIFFCEPHRKWKKKHNLNGDNSFRLCLKIANRWIGHSFSFYLSCAHSRTSLLFSEWKADESNFQL